MPTHKSCDSRALALNCLNTNMAGVAVILGFFLKQSLHWIWIDWTQNFDSFEFKVTVAVPRNVFDKDKLSLLFHTPAMELITSMFATKQKAFIFVNCNSVRTAHLALTFERNQEQVWNGAMNPNKKMATVNCWSKWKAEKVNWKPNGWYHTREILYKLNNVITPN